MVRYLLVFILFLTGCAITKTVELDLPNNNDSIEIQPGDFIELTTKKGEKHSIKVTSITERVIKSDQKSFTIEEIEKIERKELTVAGKGSAFIAGVVAGTALFLLVDKMITGLIF